MRLQAGTATGGPDASLPSPVRSFLHNPPRAACVVHAECFLVDEPACSNVCESRNFAAEKKVFWHRAGLRFTCSVRMPEQCQAHPIEGSFCCAIRSTLSHTPTLAPSPVSDISTLLPHLCWLARPSPPPCSPGACRAKACNAVWMGHIFPNERRGAPSHNTALTSRL